MKRDAFVSAMLGLLWIGAAAIVVWLWAFHSPDLCGVTRG